MSSYGEHSNEWRCLTCESWNESWRTVCKVCGDKPEKPGDWLCPYCGTWNEAGNERCKECHSWRCPYCGTWNEAGNERCKVCHSWLCPYCGTWNEAGNERCKECHSWLCPYCGTCNDATQEICSKCKKYRDETNRNWIWWVIAAVLLLSLVIAIGLLSDAFRISSSSLPPDTSPPAVPTSTPVTTPVSKPTSTPASTPTSQALFTPIIVSPTSEPELMERSRTYYDQNGSVVYEKYDDNGKLIYREGPYYTDGKETARLIYMADIRCTPSDEIYSTKYQWDIPVYYPEITLENCLSFTIQFEFESIPDTISLGQQRIFCRENGYFKEIDPIEVKELKKMYTMDVEFDKPTKVDGFATQPMRNPRSGQYKLIFVLHDVYFIKKT